MSEIPNLPEPRDTQEIREIIERHKERASNLAPIVSIGESLKLQFESFVKKEIDDIRRQLEIVSPWFPAQDEIVELQTLETEYGLLKGRLEALLTNIKKGNISNLEQLDIEAITKVFEMIETTEKLWNKVQRGSFALIRQAGLFKRWLVEMLPKEQLGKIKR
jgi:hypothetical protein